MRLDKFIWTVRLYKTRAQATKACVLEKVKLNGTYAKAAKEVAVGDEIEVKVNPIWKTFRILNIPKSRVGAKLLFQFLKETTTEENNKKLAQSLNIKKQQHFAVGKGRPTKRDRRRLDRMNE
jgi:ribosome-associated heat shock protein Hsp15